MNNSSVVSKHMWAVRQESTGEGNQIDSLVRKIKGIKSEIKTLEKSVNVLPKLPRKGETFTLRKKHPFGSTMYNLTGRVLSRSGKWAEIELLDAPKDVKPWWVGPKSPNGFPIIRDELKYLLPSTKNLAAEDRIKELEKELSDLFQELDQADASDRYDMKQHDWIPTTYSKKNSVEWFAELCTALVLSDLAAPVEDWLRNVIKTGKSV